MVSIKWTIWSSLFDTLSCLHVKHRSITIRAHQIKTLSYTTDQPFHFVFVNQHLNFVSTKINFQTYLLFDLKKVLTEIYLVKYFSIFRRICCYQAPQAKNKTKRFFALLANKCDRFLFPWWLPVLQWLDLTCLLLSLLKCDKNIHLPQIIKKPC